jgi:hypothetical protein
MKRVLLMLLLAGLAVMILATAGLAAQEFSADMVSTTKAGTVTGKIYVSQDKTRVEMSKSISISRIDKKVVWVLMPEQKMYSENQLKPEQMASATPDKMPGEVERTLIGPEKLDGKNVLKYKITYTESKKKVVIWQWILADTSFPVKTASEDGSWTTEFKNLKTGKQPESLFEIPEGYQLMSMGNMFKNMFKTK